MPVGGLTRSLKYNIKMDLRLKGCEDVTSIQCSLVGSCEHCNKQPGSSDGEFSY
jgi:hypothetical protein